MLDSPPGPVAVEDHHAQQAHELDGEIDQTGQPTDERDHQAREADLRDEVPVHKQAVDRPVDGPKEVVPAKQGRVVEDGIRHPVRGQLGHHAEDERVEGHAEQWIEHVPQRPQRHLAVAALQVAQDEEADQEPVLPRRRGPARPIRATGGSRWLASLGWRCWLSWGSGFASDDPGRMTGQGGRTTIVRRGHTVIRLPPF